jgi:hypothetical protein
MALDIEKVSQSRHPAQKVALMALETLEWVNGRACDGLHTGRIASPP